MLAGQIANQRGATLMRPLTREFTVTDPLELSHRISRAGEAVVQLCGDLDIVSAEAAVSYVTDVIDCHGGPVTVDLSALAFCDARGLAALVRMAGHAELSGCPFRLASPKPSLITIMRITGLHRRFLFDLQYDHVIPVALGGATTTGNLQLLCADCNRKKGADL
jgi:anti-anti-sigma factor